MGSRNSSFKKKGTRDGKKSYAKSQRNNLSSEEKDDRNSALGDVTCASSRISEESAETAVSHGSNVSRDSTLSQRSLPPLPTAVVADIHNATTDQCSTEDNRRNASSCNQSSSTALKYEPKLLHLQESELSDNSLTEIQDAQDAEVNQSKDPTIKFYNSNSACDSTSAKQNISINKEGSYLQIESMIEKTFDTTIEIEDDSTMCKKSENSGENGYEVVKGAKFHDFEPENNEETYINCGRGCEESKIGSTPADAELTMPDAVDTNGYVGAWITHNNDVPGKPKVTTGPCQHRPDVESGPYCMPRKNHAITSRGLERPVQRKDGNNNFRSENDPVVSKRMKICALMKVEFEENMTCTLKLRLLLGIIRHDKTTQSLDDSLQKVKQKGFRAVHSTEFLAHNFDYSSKLGISVTKAQWIPSGEVTHENMEEQICGMDRFWENAAVDMLFWQRTRIMGEGNFEPQFAVTVHLQQDGYQEVKFNILESLRDPSFSGRTANCSQCTKPSDTLNRNIPRYNFALDKDGRSSLSSLGIDYDLHSDGSCPDAKTNSEVLHGNNLKTEASPKDVVKNDRDWLGLPFKTVLSYAATTDVYSA